MKNYHFRSRLLILVFLYSNFRFVCSSIPDDELVALETLFNSTSGDNWKWRSESFGSKWNFTSKDVKIILAIQMVNIGKEYNVLYLQISVLM